MCQLMCWCSCNRHTAAIIGQQEREIIYSLSSSMHCLSTRTIHYSWLPSIATDVQFCYYVTVATCRQVVNWIKRLQHSMSVCCFDYSIRDVEVRLFVPPTVAVHQGDCMRELTLKCDGNCNVITNHKSIAMLGSHTLYTLRHCLHNVQWVYGRQYAS